MASVVVASMKCEVMGKVDPGAENSSCPCNMEMYSPLLSLEKEAINILVRL